jgi:plasmid replication initiation protein
MDCIKEKAVLHMDSSLTTGNLIEKSKALVWAKFKDWDTAELRLLEVYLSRIDARNPESATVQFTMREYGELLGLAHLQYEQANNLVTKFVAKSVSFERKDNKGRKAFTAVPLFYSATCDMDDESNQYIIKIRCHPDLEPVFFSLAQDGYIKYRLRNTVKMNKQYSVQLYGLLLDMMHIKGGWQISISKLREQLGATSKGYDAFKNFRRYVLDTSIAEINDVSDITASYTRIMTGRTCTAVRFTAEYKDSQRNQPKKQIQNPYAAIMPVLSESQCKKIGEMVKRKVKELYPDIAADKVEPATLDILKNAYKDLIESRETFPDNPGGYIWSVLAKSSAIDEYIPASYLF